MAAPDDKAPGAENVMPYTAEQPKTEQVEKMFDAIAPAYDFMNTAMTFGLHRVWRNIALRSAALAIKEKGGDGPADILDVATGTGDVAIELHRRWPRARIVGIDLSEGMLNVGRKKIATRHPNHQKLITLESGDCLNMRFPDGSFDLITVAYGVRNFEHLDQGLREMWRVMRPGGTLCVVELSEPTSRITRSLYRLYSRKLIPLIGKLISGDSRAYSYLPESIAACPQRRDMAALIKKAGFHHCRWRSLTFGVVTFYFADKR